MRESKSKSKSEREKQSYRERGPGASGALCVSVCGGDEPPLLRHQRRHVDETGK